MKTTQIPASVVAGGVAAALLVTACIFSSTLKASETATVAPKELDLITCTKCHSDVSLAEHVQRKLGNTDQNFVKDYTTMLAQLRIERHLPPRNPNFVPRHMGVAHSAGQYDYSGNKI